MPDYSIFDVKVSIITPLHIGNGRILLNYYDYDIRDGKTWRINEDALLDAQDVDDPQQAELLARTPPADLLRPEDFKEEAGKFFRYVIQGTPRATGEGAELHEQIKDPLDRLYLPGTSLKGSLRTAIAWYAWQAKNLQPDARKLGNSPRWAASEYERMLLGPNPNKDLLRALHVGDSKPLDASRLMLVNVRVVNLDGTVSAPVEVEAIKPDTVFDMQIKFDWQLFSEWAKGAGLRLQGEEWLRRLSAVVNQHSQQRIAIEQQRFEELPSARRVASFYRTLAQSSLPKDSFLLQLGWGTGWDDKTFGSRLKTDEQFMEHIIRQFRMARGKRQRGDPFPKSRRLAIAYGRDANGRVVSEAPAYPLGWVFVEMTEKR